jgi:hypothetical protein
VAGGYHHRYPGPCGLDVLVICEEHLLDSRQFCAWYSFASYLLYASSQTSLYVQDDGFLHLPSSMLVFLRSPRIQKYGVHIKADLTRLFRDCGCRDSDEPFVGAVELGLMAKQRNFTDRANISLVDLVATVLRRYLSKDANICVSTAWDNRELTPEQKSYAALDVFAGACVLEAFDSISAGTPVSITTPGGTRVKLLSRDQTSTVAYGTIALHRPPSFGGIKVTPTRTIVNITSVITPSYLVRAELLEPKQELPLSRFGTAFPFGLLCKIKDLETCAGAPAAHAPDSRTAPLPPQPFPTSAEPYNDGDVPSGDPDQSSIPDELSLLSCSLDYNLQLEEDLSSVERDPAAEVQAMVLCEASLMPVDGSVIRSRVLGDIWHLMDQFKISVHHGLRRPFARALRDALLLPDPEDKAAVERVLEKCNTTFAEKVLCKSDWVWQRIKRFVPPPEVLVPRVCAVLQMYGPLKDATTGLPLFNDASWDKAKNVIENIRMGFYSDPPGINLYTIQRQDKDGLFVYRCERGTNNVEGGIHQNIIKRFGSYNASPRFAVNLLRDYCLCHNLRVRAHIC